MGEQSLEPQTTVALRAPRAPLGDPRVCVPSRPRLLDAQPRASDDYPRVVYDVACGHGLVGLLVAYN